MPLTTDMTTISVVVAMTTPSNVRKERSLWLRSASSAIQKASRAVTQRVAPRARRAGCADGFWSAGCGVTVPPRCLYASCLPCLPLHEVIIPLGSTQPLGFRFENSGGRSRLELTVTADGDDLAGHGSGAQMVGRTPWSAADALVGLPQWCKLLILRTKSRTRTPARTWGSVPPIRQNDCLPHGATGRR